MFIAIDLIIVVIMAAVIFKAVKKGFVSSLFGLLTAAVSLIVAIMFYKELGIYINDTYLLKAIEPHIVEFVEDTVIDQGGALGAEAFLSQLPDELRALMDMFGIEITNLFDGLGEMPAQIAKTLASEISLALSNVIAFGLVFLVAFLALSVLCYVLDALAKLPVLNGINKFFGLLLGVVEAAVLGMVIAKLAGAVCSVHATLSGDTAFVNVIDKTIVAKFLLSFCPW